WWHAIDYLIRRCGRDPSQRLIKRVDQRLNRRRVSGNEVLFGVEHCRRVSAPEDLVIYARETRIGDDSYRSILLQTGDQRIRVGDGADPPRRHRIDGPFSAAHAHERSISRRKASPGHEVEHKEVAGRVRGSHTDLEAFEVGI